MGIHFEELDDTTRKFMLLEFEIEERSGNPYRSRCLSAFGRQEFPDVLREALTIGDEETLIRHLLRPDFWNTSEEFVRDGLVRRRKVNWLRAAERLGLTEFSTWYTRGFVRRLLEEGAAECQVYLAGAAKCGTAKCPLQKGMRLPASVVYDGHRSRYWALPPRPWAISIPIGPNCHHSVRRVRRGSNRPAPSPLWDLACDLGRSQVRGYPRAG